MIGIDTNVLLRFLVTDDPVQHPIAALFIHNRTAADPAFVSLVVLVETIWTLRRAHRLADEDINRAFAALLSTSDFVFEDQAFLAALFAEPAATRSDIADRVIARVAERHGCDHVVTFDRCAAQAIPSMQLLT